MTVVVVAVVFTIRPRLETDRWLLNSLRNLL